MNMCMYVYLSINYRAFERNYLSADRGLPVHVSTTAAVLW